MYVLDERSWFYRYSHLHFDITGRQPSGKWGIIDGYVFLWDAYVRNHQPELMAVARPHYFAVTGERVALDGSRSWSASGSIKEPRGNNLSN